MGNYSERLRFANGPEAIKSYNTTQLRKEFLIDDLFVDDAFTVTYSMYDRMMILSAKPVYGALVLPAYEEFTKASFFLERREMGIINIGGKGYVIADGQRTDLATKDCLYLGKGIQNVTFYSNDPLAPAEFYINSANAHTAYPAVKYAQADARKVNVGASATLNERTIYQYIHEDGIQSCQLVMGLTEFAEGSIWNTFPPHTHLRRMEAYLYFNLPPNQLVMHFMGEPDETRHLVVRNKQAIISPEWSIHSGVGTMAYSFIWGMAGENKAFTDMDAVDTQTTLR